MFSPAPGTTGGAAAPPTRRVWALGDRYVLEFPYHRGMVDDTKRLPGADYDRFATRWTVPVGHAPAVLEWGVKWGAALPPSLRSLLPPVSPLEALATALEPVGGFSDPAGLSAPLRPYQRAALQYFDRVGGRTLVADEMSLGKTATAFAWAARTNAFPFLFVTNKAALGQQAKAVAQWLPGLRLLVVGTNKKAPTPADLNRADAVVASYEALVKYGLDRGEPWPLLVVDESKAVKNEGTQRHRAVARLRCSDWLCLDGTPYTTSQADLWGQLRVLRRGAELFGDRDAFLARYTTTVTTPDGRERRDDLRIPELRSRLLGACMVQRTVEQALPQLPEAVLLPEWGAVPDLRGYRSDLDAALAGADLDREDQVQQVFAVERRLLAERKVEWATAVVNRLLDEGGGKVVVFPHHRSLQDELARRFRNLACVIAQGQTPEETERQRTRFFEDPDRPVMVCSLTMGSAALELHCATQCLFPEPWYTATTHLQAVGRLRRPPNWTPVRAWFLLAEGTLDEPVWGLLQRRWGNHAEFTGRGDRADLLRSWKQRTRPGAGVAHHAERRSTANPIIAGPAGGGQ